jgi:hypothetical protein
VAHGDGGRLGRCDNADFMAEFPKGGDQFFNVDGLPIARSSAVVVEYFHNTG